MYDTIRAMLPKLGLAGAAIAPLLIAMSAQAQVTEAEMVEINQFYLDAYAIQDAALAAYSNPSVDGAAAFDQCVQQVNGLTLPDYMLTAAQTHGFNGYEAEGWVNAFCDRVHLNYIFFATGPKFD